MDTNQTIESLNIERQQNLERAKMISEVARDGGREELSTEEQGTQDKYLDRVESINRELGTLERIEKLEAARAVPVADDKPSGIRVTDKVREPGIMFAQMALALHRNGNDRRLAADWARAEWGDDFIGEVLSTPPATLERAAVAGGTTTDSGWASQLVQEYDRQASEFIDMLRAQTVLSQLAPRRLDFGDNKSIKIPRKTAGVAGGWVSEAGAIKVEKLTVADLDLTPSKLGSIVVISEELARESSPAALQLIRDDLVEGTAQTIDSLFISTTAASAPAPAGLLNGISGGTPSTASSDLEKSVVDLQALETSLDSANVPGSRTWIMNPAQYNSLLWMRDSYGFQYRAELTEGKLGGHRIITSTNVTDATIILVAEDQILWATGRAPTIELSRDATLMMDSAPNSPIDSASATSLFQTDQVATRLIVSLAWGVRHTEAVAYTASVTW